jgi:hypothetical protein
VFRAFGIVDSDRRHLQVIQGSALGKKLGPPDIAKVDHRPNTVATGATRINALRPFGCPPGSIDTHVPDCSSVPTAIGRLVVRRETGKESG